ncbi:3'-flap repair endonuclease Xpf [uncultured archaeon]|nr:3'-flap repair endonuclease Xpf [uncultured archaeon]
MTIAEFAEVADKTKAVVIMDTRESEDFTTLLEAHGAIVKRKQLEVADFLCSDRLVVERKTRQDFENSIIDGRLFHQLQNLLHNFERPVVVVEGEEDSGRISKEALMGAYAAVLSDYGVPLFFTKDREETAQLVFHFAKHQQLAKKQALRVYAKRKSLTPSQHQRGIVESLPGVGPKLAKALLQHFGSVAAVMNANEKELEAVEKIGKKKAKAIRSLLDFSYNSEDD